MLPPIIGIVGRSRAGKDTIASIIIELHPEYQIQRLASPLKKAVAALYNFSPTQLEDDTKEVVDTRWNKTPREAIQSLTDYMMSYMGTDFFTRRLYNDSAIPKHMIICDVRYDHDIVEIKKRGGIVIKVDRSTNMHIKHLFENHVDALVGDFEVHNNGTIDDLRREVLAILTIV
jgi:hypothetical protein